MCNLPDFKTFYEAVVIKDTIVFEQEWKKNQSREKNRVSRNRSKYNGTWHYN